MTSPSLTTPNDQPEPTSGQVTGDVSPFKDLGADEPLDALPYMSLWVRGLLVALAAFLILIFSIAIYLDPYNRDETGKIVSAKNGGTHQGLGLPPCTFKETTGVPCPSCGMTSSFSLLIRGDLWHSVQANFAGTILGMFCLFLIPWSLLSVWKQHLLWVRSFETMLTICVTSFMAIMLLRWAVLAAVQHFYAYRIPM
jgi:hypothetical protein